MYAEPFTPLTFETLLSDPLIRAVMDSDGVTLEEMRAVLVAAGEAVAARERHPESWCTN
ncbi:protein of unknown function [Rhodovastum atsumiense]|uniref:hypothetical protein n=1 Tax=Rhodovastum atsumiense TaxID=504468 RepID=UPI00139F2C0B|nr:hypothetical protein [Rhodovastum atsumiense]CAH2604115.1 protein of unknown function [Rhodovastum atsumiense]